MEYGDLNQVREEWLSGNFTYPEQIQVAGIPYKLRSSSEQKFQDVIIGGQKAYIIYAAPQTHEAEAKEQGLYQWLIFIWGVDQKSTVKPYDVRSVPPRRFVPKVMEDVERIGDVVIMKIILPSGVGALKGKVDTGAEISSLHADDIQVMNGTVKFTNQELSQNVISVPIAEKQAVKSADGGVEYRPVIELDIEINGKPIRRVLFNLNDRGEMEYPCLVGQNILEKTNFLVDPRQDDPDVEKTQMEDEWLEDFDVDVEVLNEHFKDIEPVSLEDASQSEKIQAIYNILQEADISFADLIRFIRTDAREVMTDIEY